MSVAFKPLLSAHAQKMLFVGLDDTARLASADIMATYGFGMVYGADDAAKLDHATQISQRLMLTLANEEARLVQ